MGEEVAASVHIKDTRNRSVYAIPSAAVVALSVGEKADGKDTPEAVGAVDGNGPDRIVYLHDAVNEFDRNADQHASDEANDQGPNRIDETRRRCDGHQPGRNSGAAHPQVR